MFSQAEYLHPCFFPSEEISFQPGKVLEARAAGTEEGAHSKA